MESDKYICIRETGTQNQVVIVDMATPLAPQRRQITADSALMCPDKKVIALKATTPGTPGDALQVFNLDTKTKLKSHQMPESVEFWKWITPNMLGLVTATSVYHWDIQVRPAVASTWAHQQQLHVFTLAALLQDQCCAIGHYSSSRQSNIVICCQQQPASGRYTTHYVLVAAC
jgi:hypothetical protein